MTENTIVKSKERIKFEEALSEMKPLKKDVEVNTASIVLDFEKRINERLEIK
jgi:hypothetical protein